MRYLANVLYPYAEWIDLVLDCLNTHNEETLIEIFGKAEADRILCHLHLHHTSAHASWLNMAEIEIGVLETQCLDRRIPDEFSMGKEVVVWETRRNDQKAMIQWTFIRENAEQTFCKYQSIQQVKVVVSSWPGRIRISSTSGDLRPSNYEPGGCISIASTLVQHPHIW